MIQRAMILAAGEGSRLRPLTDTRPKPMLEIGGVPLVEHTVRQLATSGVREAIINLHHHPDSVMSHFGDGSKFGIRLHYSVESELLGTAGGLKKVEEFFLKQPFYLIYGDNLSTCNLEQLSKAHEGFGGLATVALYWKEDVSPHSSVDIQPSNRIVRFVEKPKRGEEPTKWFSAGINVMDAEIMDHIPNGKYFDIGFNLFPKILAEGRKIYGYYMTGNERLWWIDTPQDYERVSTLFRSGFPYDRCDQQA